MPATACPAAEVLHDFLLGRLGGPSATALDAHLDQCPHCSASLDGLHGSDELVADLNRAGKSKLPRNSMIEQLRAKLRNLRPTSASQLRTLDSPEVTAG